MAPVTKPQLTFFSLSVLLCALPAFAAAPAPAPTNTAYQLEPGAGEVKFVAVGKPSLIKIKGEGARPTGVLKTEGENVTGEVIADLNELKTGIAMRDSHMKEKYLESNKPGNEKARLVIKRLAKACFVEASGKPCDFEGEISLHGKTQPLKGSVVPTKKDNAIALAATFALKLSDFAIDIPKFAGVTVADEVNVTAEAVARQ